VLIRIGKASYERLRLPSIFLFALIPFFVVAVGPASASITHKLEATITGTPKGPFIGACGVTTNAVTEGPVYAVSGSGGLPRLAFILNGQVNLVPRADTTTPHGAS
jgi:hypothetical protein